MTGSDGLVEPTITVVIPTVGRYESLSNLLNCIASQTKKPDRVLVIDQGPKRRSRVDSYENRLFVEYVPFDVRSLSAARQYGAGLCQTDLVAYFDDDVMISEKHLEIARDFLRKEPSAIGVGGVYLDSSTVNRSRLTILLGKVFGIYGNGSRNKILGGGWADYVRGNNLYKINPAEWLFGCNFMVRRSALKKVGFQSRMMKWCFLEDIFFGADLSAMFGQCLYTHPDLSVLHCSESSEGGLSDESIKMRIYYRYLFWRQFCYKKKFSNILKFNMGMVANVILLVRQGAGIRRVLSAHSVAIKVILSNPALGMDEVNEIIFCSK